MESKVDSQTQLYGIFGNPVSHSLSPLLHNAVFRRLNVNAVYLAFKIKPEELGLAFEAMRSLGLNGVNVTVPFKEKALEFLDETPEDLDRCIGAVNTVVNRSGKLYGYNTDVGGFLTALGEELAFDPENKTALVLGAGGAARAAVFALARARAERIFIHNRTASRAEGLKDYLSGFFPETEIEVVNSFDAIRGEKINLVVNATMLGMTPSPVCGDPQSGSAAFGGQTGDGVKGETSFDLRTLKARPAVYDMVYSPSETPLLKSAKGLGLPCANGLGMLAAQAALSFGLWTGRSEDVRPVMLETLKQCRF